jgi:hypothetical protein
MGSGEKTLALWFYCVSSFPLGTPGAQVCGADAHRSSSRMWDGVEGSPP